MQLGRSLAVFVLVTVAAAGFADDSPTPPSKHENKVTDEAKAVLEAYRKLVYAPVQHGLASMTGNLVRVGSPETKPRRFQFTRNEHIDMGAGDGVDPSSERERAGRILFGLPFEATLTGVLPTDREYDASVETSDDRRELVMTLFRGGIVGDTQRFGLDREGLVASLTVVSRPTRDGSPGMEMHLEWTVFGEQRCVDSIDWTASDRSGKTQRMHYDLHYADVAGLHLVTGYEFRMSGDGVAAVAASMRLVDLNVNGNPVETAKLHENRVSAAAREAISRYVRLVYRPSEHGLRSISGVLVPEWVKKPSPPTFTYAPAIGLRTTLADRTHTFALSLAFEGAEVTGGPEFDADVRTEENGRRVLVVAGFSGGVPTDTRELSLDADGLATNVVSRMAADARRVVEFQFAWEKTGELRRIANMTIVARDGDRQLRRNVYTLAYATVDQVEVLTGFTVRSIEDELERVFTYRIEDMILNGNQVVLPHAVPGPK